MREADQGAAEPGQGAQVQGTDEAAGMMLEGGLHWMCRPFYFVPILSEFCPIFGNGWRP